MLRAPEHLSAISQICTDLSTDVKLVANIVCSCGGTSFILKHAVCDDSNPDGPVTAEVDGAFFYVIRAKCTKCEKDHLIFDADYHGWDGYVCFEENNGRPNPRPPMTSWSCTKCNNLHHSLQVVVSMDQEMILEDGPVEDNNGKIILNESNFQEGFDWISMTTKCHSCKYINGSWVEYETM